MSCRQLLMAGVLLVGTGHATAQTGTPPTVDLAAGWVGFADDGIVSELPVTGAIRLYVTPRISIGAELTHIAGRSHSHQVLTGNLALDLVTSRPGRVTPFLLIGGGLFRTNESFGSTSFTSTEGAWTLGGGLRYRANRRVSVGVDARSGWEPHVRVMGVASIHLGR